MLLEALGQAFFSLSMGTACLCTYASYFNRQTNLLKSSYSNVTIDTVIAVLAGLMIQLFSVGCAARQWSLSSSFTLPNGGIPGGLSVTYARLSVVISVLFYALLVLAA